VGVATLGSLKAKLMKGKIHSTDPVEAAVYTQFKKLCLDTTLSKLNSILDTDHFALVVHKQRIYTSDMAVEEQEVIVGIVTDIDLLQYISKAEQGSGSGSESPKNGGENPQC
jgi:cystathionine beta-synthase